MVFQVRCYKCGEQEVRLILGGRQIIHARCQACESNLLAEVMEFETEIERRRRAEDQRQETTSLLKALPKTSEEAGVESA